ncbi:DUF362 domain-containing protein [Candidatus Fermentibacteria bacterium]|nr:DUF362 domain-containing protein [Candidatus Fermentibacteria bacterium]
MRMITRRRFLAGSIATAVGSVIPHELFAGSARNTRVVIVTDENAVSGSTVYADIVRQMVNAGIKQLTGQPTIGSAWYSLLPGITSSSKVSLKENNSNGERWEPRKAVVHPCVTDAVVQGLRQMPLGAMPIPLESIMVWDLDKAPIVGSGYTINLGGPGVQVYYAVEDYRVWTNDYSGPGIGNDLVGDGLGFSMSSICTIDHPFPTPDSSHHPATIITDYTDYMINVGVLGYHSDAQITGVLKNHYGSFDNIRIGSMHGSGISRGIPGLSAYLRDSFDNIQRVFMIDGLFGCCQYGPQAAVDCVPKTIILGTDPVAVDYQMTQVLNYYRSLVGAPPLNPAHVNAAAGAPFNLGTNNPANIDLVQITNPSVPPAQVQNVRSTTVGSDVVLDWDAVAGVSNYNVYRHSIAYPQAPGTLIGSTVGATFTHVGVAGEPFGFYTVTAEY